LIFIIFKIKLRILIKVTTQHVQNHATINYAKSTLKILVCCEFGRRNLFGS